MPHFPSPCRAFALVCALLTGHAHADLQDEIQVYDDGINERGEFGLELHVNATPSGRGTSDYPGEVPPGHAWRYTPEFSYGLSPEVELGLYLPMLRDPQGHFDIAGVKLRLKWLPLQPKEDGGAFAGVNFELSRLAQPYSESRTSLEARFIAGWRNPDWLLAVNPILGFGLSDGFAGRRPDVDLGVKVARRLGQGFSGGLELYSGLGPIGRSLPWQQQDQRLFMALDVDRKPWVFNLGVGRGLTDAADRWTLKAIFEVPI
jgi:hypothetical protein